MRDHLLLYVNGVRHVARGARAFQSLSDFLRYDLRLTGTKIVCAEGDCGSCSVLLGRAAGDRMRYRAVTSCIQFLFQLDGTHVITVEGLRDEGDAPNPVQRAMVSCHGAQCGFCTPGFVVAMCGVFEQAREANANVDETSLRRGLVGNLCRCTGYEAILTAGLAVDLNEVRRVDELYPPGQMLAELQGAARDSIELTADDGRVAFVPASLGEALAFKAARPDCVVFAGGTDLGVQVNKGRRDPQEVLVLTRLPELCGATVAEGAVTIGACATLSTLEAATREAIPEVHEMLWRFGSPPIRNAGTVGGNLANGSPIADTLPAWFVLGATVDLASARGTRTVGVGGFYTAYKRSVMAADELIARLTVPRVPAGHVLRLYKVSKRRDLDISSFTAAFLMRVDDGRVGSIRVAYGGVGPTVLRLTDVERWLIGKPVDEATFAEAGDRAAAAVTPISDVRGSAAYRATLARNAFVKFFHDASGGHDVESPSHHGNGDGHAVASWIGSRL